MASSDKPLPPKLQESINNSKCEYRYLGKSGLRISVPIFGCMSFGDTRTMDWVLEEDEASKIPVSTLREWLESNL